MKGLEPPRLSAPDPKSGAATNYATSAFKMGNKNKKKKRLVKSLLFKRIAAVKTPEQLMSLVFVGFFLLSLIQQAQLNSEIHSKAGNTLQPVRLFFGEFRI
jgi:hypothetical protein